MKTIKNNILVIFVIILFMIALASCKKETKVTPSPIVQQPAPIGAMEGKYKWYAGDSVTADLVLTTNVLNCQYCAMVGYDYYYSNLTLAKIDGYYYVCPKNQKLDTLIFGYNSKTFKYYRY